MAASRMIPRTNSSSYFIRPSSDQTYRQINSTEDIFEFDESDVWSSSYQLSSAPPSRMTLQKKLQPAVRKINAGGGTERAAPAAASSLPVNIPDWSKILKDGSGSRDSDVEDDVDENYEDVENRVPPHEYLARRRGASFSVHEGVGRTLKGRDLRRVRNAIWKQVGFED